MSELATIELKQEHVISNANTAIFSAQNLAAIQNFATIMAGGKATVPKHLAGSPADCMAVTMQAAQWGMNPFAVAQKTHLVNGTLGYEAQLVNAVIVTSGAIIGRFKYKYHGPWEIFIGDAKKNKANEIGLSIQVGALIRGDTEITWLEPLHLADVEVRNSPLWKTNPKQQLAYLAVKYWARLHTPEVILGVYTPDELEQEKSSPKDITPKHSAENLNQLLVEKPKDEVSDAEITDSEERKQDKRNPDELLHAFGDAANQAPDLATLDKAYGYAKSTLLPHPEQLAAATDIYHIRVEEITSL